MRSGRRGRRTSNVEVTNVSKDGLWLLLGDRELFVSFKHFPWFQDAPVRRLLNVELPQEHHLYWPDLDIDIAVESIEHPERYPLVSRASFGGAPRPAPRLAGMQVKERTPSPRRR